MKKKHIIPSKEERKKQFDKVMKKFDEVYNRDDKPYNEPPKDEEVVVPDLFDMKLTRHNDPVEGRTHEFVAVPSEFRQEVWDLVELAIQTNAASVVEAISNIKADRYDITQAAEDWHAAVLWESFVRQLPFDFDIETFCKKCPNKAIVKKIQSLQQKNGQLSPAAQVIEALGDRHWLDEDDRWKQEYDGVKPAVLLVNTLRSGASTLQMKKASVLGELRKKYNRKYGSLLDNEDWWYGLLEKYSIN